MAAKIRGLIHIRNKDKIISVLTSAFIDYPKLTKVFPQKDRRAIAVEANLRFYVSYAMRYGGAYTLNDNCQAIVVIITSSRRKASKLKYIIAGSYSKKYKTTVLRLTKDEQEIRLKIFEEMNKMETEIVFPSKYLYISFLGVRPDCQKQGYGREIIEKVSVYARGKRLPIVLFTNEPNGVEFYQSMGFKIMGITSSKKFQFINIYLIKS